MFANKEANGDNIKHGLKATFDTVLLVNVSKSFHLLAFLEQASDGEDHSNIDTNHTKHRREDIVDEHIRK